MHSIGDELKKIKGEYEKRLWSEYNINAPI